MAKTPARLIAFVAFFSYVLTATADREVNAEPVRRRPPTRWQNRMDKFAEEDARSRYRAGGIVFVGSSSIQGWDLSKSFPDLPVINRGFGGSHIADSTHYIDLLVVKLRPKTVVLYAGDNDIKHGLTPDQVVSDYQAFVSALKMALPDARLIFLAIKPSLKRWSLYPSMQIANRRIAEIAKGDPHQIFVDIATPMLATDDGTPNRDLFVKDGLHLNDAGYELWSSLLAPHLVPRKTAPNLD